MDASWEEFACACSIWASRSVTCRLTSESSSAGLMIASANSGKCRLEPRRRYVEDGLDPGKADIDPEAGTFGLQQLGELLARMGVGALVQAAGRDGGDPLVRSVLVLQTQRQHQMTDHYVLPGKLVDDEVKLVGERAPGRGGEVPAARRGHRGLLGIPAHARDSDSFAGADKVSGWGSATGSSLPWSGATGAARREYRVAR